MHYPSSRKQITIRHKEYWIITDPDYGKHLGDNFEPNTVNLLESLCDPDSQVLDVGANIGITGIAIAQLAPDGRVASIEPVSVTYQFLKINMANSKHFNVTTHNFALGNKEGEIRMQGHPDNLSGAFVADLHTIDDGFHFSVTVKQHKLDDIFQSLNLDRVDLIKMDVEGYELDVLEGAACTLDRFKPIVLLEMNHVALNLWRGMSLPEFRERLLKVFPFVYAVHGAEYLDFRDSKQSHLIQFRHLNNWAFMDVVCGFDNEALVNRLDTLPDIQLRNEKFVPENDLTLANQRIVRLEDELRAANQRIVNLETSRSWKITAPLRSLMRLLYRR